MQEKREGNLVFCFPESWTVSKYDEWSFQRQFQNICGGAKATDFLAENPADSILWLIEVKDYRQHRRIKTEGLPLEIACKFRDTLAGLACARVNSNSDEERLLADSALQTGHIRLVLHLEQPAKHSKLFPKPFDPADIKQKLKAYVKAIDPHPMVVDKTTANLEWDVRNFEK